MEGSHTGLVGVHKEGEQETPLAGLKKNQKKLAAVLARSLHRG